MQQSRVIPSPRSFACDLATLCAPTLAGPENSKINKGFIKS